MSSKKKITNHFVSVNHKRYSYSLKPVNKKVTHVKCVDANIDQEFLNEDIAAFLIDLPELILAEKKYKNEQTEVIRFRVSPEDKKAIEKKALKQGFNNVSSFLRRLALES
ncbi:MAG: hypothetical protein ABII18_05090 [bacterium]|nr:hypothetical protein [bacterium]MBU1916537.1 hypothetical protein [bacterium]